MAYRFRAMLVMSMMGLVFVSSSDLAHAKKKRSKKPAKLKTVHYKIKKGDTLGGIAAKHKTTVKLLMRWNKGLKPTNLRPGKTIKIAVTPTVYNEIKYGKKRKVAKRKNGLPPKKLGPRDNPPATLASIGVVKPTGELPPMPVKPEEVVAVARLEHIPSPDSMEFGGEELSVIETLDELVASGKARKLLYVVQPDENVGSIALKFRLDPEDIWAWNELETLVPEPGTALLLQSDKTPAKPRGPLPVTHRVKKGENYQKIAKKYRVSTKQLKKWNRRVNPKRLKIGQKLTLYVTPRDGVSRSHGSANGGRLRNGVPLESTRGLKVRTVANSYGTQRVVRMLKAASWDMQARWPDAPELVVGDLSYKHGGRIKKHKSHQSGRDADISFYYRANVQLPDFRDMDYETFDSVKNWHIFKTLIDTGEVEYIFIDYPLQRELYEYAKSIGYTDAQLEPLIQYPRPISTSVGIIRHVRGHDDHWHIRFKCGPQDTHCR